MQTQVIQSLPLMKKMWETAERNYRNKQHPDDFPELPEIPAGRYTREDFYQLEKKFVWKRSWLLAGVAGELPSPGSYKTLTLCETPILLARGDDQKIRAFYNTCQHRGAMLVPTAEGTERRFVCRYHCWTYDLEGKLKFVADEHLLPGLDKSKKSLRSIRCELFGNLVFINFDGNAAALTDFLGDILDVVADVPLDKLQLYRTISIDAPYNWKVMQDNFSENYHAKFIHPTTLDQVIDAKVSARQLLTKGHAAFAIRSRGKAEDGVALKNLFDRSSAAADNSIGKGMLNELTQVSQRNYNIFPNLTAPIAENLFPVIAVWPVTVAKSRIEIYFLRLADDRQDTDTASAEAAIAFLETIIGEDLGALTGMQEALSSGGIESLRFSWEEQVLYHYNRHIDQMIGRENIPPELVVPEIPVPIASSGDVRG